MANSNNIREGFSCGCLQNGNSFQQSINMIDPLQNPQNSQNSALLYPPNAQQFGQNETNQQILSQQNNAIPIPQSQNNYGSFIATHDNYAVIPDQQFCYSQNNHNHPVTSPQITFTHEVPGIPGYTVMLIFIPNNLNMQNQQSQHNDYLNNYFNNHR